MEEKKRIFAIIHGDVLVTKTLAGQDMSFFDR